MNRNKSILASITAVAAFSFILVGCSLDKASDSAVSVVSCVGDSCSVAASTASVPAIDAPLCWPMTLSQAQASGVTQLVAVVWNPGCGWCRRAMPVFNDPAVCSGLTVDRGFALANMKAQSADGKRLLARARVLEFPAVVVMRRKAGVWEVVGAKVYRPVGASVEGFLAFVDAIGR